MTLVVVVVSMLPVEFLVLLLSSLCGLGAVSALLAIPVATAGLLASSLPKYLAFWERAKEVDRVGAVVSSMALSVLNAFVASAAAYGMGLVLRFVVSDL